MDQDQFDEFQYAKQPNPMQNSPQNPSNSQNYSNKAEGTLQNHSLINQYQLNPPYLNSQVQDIVNTNENFQSEQLLPNLDKIGSSQDVSNFQHVSDFRKINSQAEGAKVENQFIHLSLLGKADDTKNQLALSFNGINEEYTKTSNLMNSYDFQFESLHYNEPTQPFVQFQQVNTMRIQNENIVSLENNSTKLIQESVNTMMTQNMEQISGNHALDFLSFDQEQTQQARKESQQFVFAQHNAEQSKEPQQLAVQKQAEEQPNSRKQSQEFDFQQADPSRQTNIMTQQVSQEDQFGDFEEVIPSESRPQDSNYQTNQHNSIQSSTVEIKEEYLNSSETEYYQAKRTELQNFINSLPDYSFLFAQSFA